MTPRTKAISLYYKTKQCVHHFTFYKLATKDVYSYVWHEGEGALTANEFASCVTDFLTDNPGFSRYILYSDGCTYQKRNFTLAKALLHFAVTHKVEVEQKFLEKGHTQMEVDSVHGCIERHLKNASIYVPAQLVDKIESARTKLFPYRVKYLHQDFFKDLTHVCNLTSIRPERTAGDPTVTDLRNIRYTPDKTISFKLNHTNEPYMPLPKGRSQSSWDKIKEPQQLYSSSQKIKKEKYQHLQSLKAVIPADDHPFYDNLLM